MKTTKHLTTGAMTVALTTLVMLFDRATVGVFMSFLPVPLIVYGFYFGLKSSFPVYVACVVSSTYFHRIFTYSSPYDRLWSYWACLYFCKFQEVENKANLCTLGGIRNTCLRIDDYTIRSFFWI
ncbi:hypothetical protein MGH68_00155 [Erysipelothrix sp. D19-032]